LWKLRSTIRDEPECLSNAQRIYMRVSLYNFDTATDHRVRSWERYRKLTIKIPNYFETSNPRFPTHSTSTPNHWLPPPFRYDVTPIQNGCGTILVRLWYGCGTVVAYCSRGVERPRQLFIKYTQTKNILSLMYDILSIECSLSNYTGWLFSQRTLVILQMIKYVFEKKKIQSISTICFVVRSLFTEYSKASRSVINNQFS